MFKLKIIYNIQHYKPKLINCNCCPWWNETLQHSMRNKTLILQMRVVFFRHRKIRISCWCTPCLVSTPKSPVATPKWSRYLLYIFSEVVYICNKDSILFKDFCGDCGLVCKGREKKTLWPKARIFHLFKVAEFIEVKREMKTWGQQHGRREGTKATTVPASESQAVQLILRRCDRVEHACVGSDNVN